ncbi:hypothetical protein SDJN02_04998, partial [Cucurbita argyrosperma subsp. argyrosperma]
MEKMGDARGHSIIRKQETVATFIYEMAMMSICHWRWVKRKETLLYGKTEGNVLERSPVEAHM